MKRPCIPMYALLVITGCGEPLVDGTAALTLAVTGISPTRVAARGGDAVTVDGRNFAPTATVIVDGAAITDVVWVSPERLTFRTPVLTVGPKSVVVQNSTSDQASAPGPLFAFADSIHFAEQHVLITEGVFAVALGDVDGDYLDDVVAEMNDGRLTVFLNDSRGYRMRPTATFGQGDFDADPLREITDVNGDGLGDVITEGFVYLSVGDGLLGPGLPFSDALDWEFNRTVVADFDNDGVNEIARFGRTQTGATLTVYGVTQADTLQMETQPSLGAQPCLLAHSTESAAGDVNGDGFDDLVFVGEACERVQVLFGPGLDIQTAWTSPEMYPVVTDFENQLVPSVSALDIVDINDDGTADILVALVTGEELTYAGRGAQNPGPVATRTSLCGFGRVDSLLGVDFGIPIVTASWCSLFVFTHVWFGAQATLLSPQASGLTPTLGDLDGDGSLDFVTGDGSAVTARFGLFDGFEQAHWGLDVLPPNDPNGCDSEELYWTTGNFGPAATVAAACREHVTIAGFVDGAVRERSMISTGLPALAAITACDVDGDQDDDIVLLYGDGNMFNVMSTVQIVLMQDGQSQLGASATFAGTPVRMHGFDFDSDGLCDIHLFSDFDLETATVLTLRSTGTTLQPSTRVDMTVRGGGIDWATTLSSSGTEDIDLDGDIDLYATDGARLILWNNEQTGSWSEGQPSLLPADLVESVQLRALPQETPDTPNSLIVWMAAYPDVASNNAAMVRAERAPSGTYRDRATGPVCRTIACRLLLGDINGDAIDDAIYVGLNSEVVLTSPTGGLDVAVSAQLGIEAGELFDFDGDGLADIVYPGINGKLLFVKNESR